jgi:hypothetical protein
MVFQRWYVSLKYEADDSSGHLGIWNYSCYLVTGQFTRYHSPRAPLPVNLLLYVIARLTRVKADGKDNTRYAFLQLDDRVLVYRGADQPDMSVINPESDVWQHIKVRSPIQRKGEKLIPDPKRIYIDKLANPLRFNFVRRETNSHSRKTWVNSLLRCIRSMEVV